MERKADTENYSLRELKSRSRSFSNQNSVVLVNRQIDLWNEIKIPERHSHKYNQLIFDRQQKYLNGRKTGFSTNGAGKTGHHMQIIII